MYSWVLSIRVNSSYICICYSFDGYWFLVRQFVLLSFIVVDFQHENLFIAWNFMVNCAVYLNLHRVYPRKTIEFCIFLLFKSNSSIIFNLIDNFIRHKHDNWFSIRNSDVYKFTCAHSLEHAFRFDQHYLRVYARSPRNTLFSNNPFWTLNLKWANFHFIIIWFTKCQLLLHFQNRKDPPSVKMTDIIHSSVDF